MAIAAGRRRMPLMAAGLVAAFLCFAVAYAEDIHGCGGFVGASSALTTLRKPSDPKPDYSHISVELCSVDGLVKERTHCAPNGYYFIPVYDKGSFIVRVKGPSGWSWNPESVPVAVDHNGCNGNEDINFQFTGFKISGRIVGASTKSCRAVGKGPADVKIELLSQSGDPVLSTLTSSAGQYSFSNVTPGTYVLRASHTSYEIELRGSSEVHLSFGNVEVDDIFYVSGYSIDGTVVAQGNPILGVHMYLYSDGSASDLLPCMQDLVDAPRPGPACHTISDADGKFKFNAIPCGNYRIIPYYKREITVFDVHPRELDVEVLHHHVHVPREFEVAGFSVVGRVVDGSGAGVMGAEIHVDGVMRAVTDNSGYYKLDEVRSKRYTISAKKEHYKFRPLKDYLVLPNREYIDEIFPVLYDVCGAIRMTTGNFKAMVILQHDNDEPQKKIVREDGTFCFEVPYGSFRLAAQPVDADTTGFVFSPSHIDVKVHSPVLGVQFVQSQVNVHGSVQCKEKCSSNILLILSRLVSGLVKESQSTHLRLDNGFSFSGVLPGKYRLEIKHDLSSAVKDNWCWNHDSIDLDVGTSDITGVKFIQKGYWIELVSTHSTDAYIIRPDFSKINLSIQEGSQRICVETFGDHELKLLNSCISFGDASIIFDTRNVLPVHLSAQKYLISGVIQLNLDAQQESNFSEDIVVNLYSKHGEFIKTIPTIYDSIQSQQNAYGYSTWASFGDEFLLIPRDLSTVRKKILFYPPQRQVSVTSNGCQGVVPTVVGRSGLYLEGFVKPATSDVNVKVLAQGKSGFIALEIGDIAFETVTREDGSFIAGPLYDDITYEIEASKSGYHVKKDSTNSFTCQKLGQILVRIHGGSETELLPPVLLSLSGEHGYRNNSVSGDGGTFSFENLFPGSFYLRPLLKEYSFSPAADAIDLGSGESRVVEFRATRVAYSATGFVSLLSGQPKEGIFVEARSMSKGYYEEALTDSSGHYRLRGLAPGTSYIITVVARENIGSSTVERASPESVEIEVGNGDIGGVDFVVFEVPDTAILSGHVEGDDLDVTRQHLSVEVRSASDPSRVASVIPLPLSNFFQVRDLSKGRYLVQLKSGLPSNTHRFDAEVLEVDLEKQPQTHVGPLKYKIVEHHHKQDLTPAPVFPLIVGVSCIALLISLPRLNEFYQMAVGAATSAMGTTSAKKDLKKAPLKKRV